eukprot:GDKH01008303.1.p1 GENE.GDKH01008303.1~~GDKH01008303.1.p1  ORF type:complete len:112 (-),score=11.09 GDKH01008303.1:270-605(-)
MLSRSFARRLPFKMPFSPFNATEPHWVHHVLNTSRKGKDMFEGAHSILASTGIYERFLKHTGTYWLTIVVSAMVGNYYWSVMWEKYWRKVNKGKLYVDCPYKYPPSDDDDE